MRINRTFIASMAIVFAGALPSMAAEPTAPAATGTSPTVAAPAPAELPWLLPEPIPAAAQKPGPCTVSVPCRFGAAVSCSGGTVCYWQYDSKFIRGYVSCDGGFAYCPLATE
jgi:hypothetical protein